MLGPPSPHLSLIWGAFRSNGCSCSLPYAHSFPTGSNALATSASSLSQLLSSPSNSLSSATPGSRVLSKSLVFSLNSCPFTEGKRVE